MKKSTLYIAFALTSLSIISCSKSNDIEETPVSEFVQIPDANFEKKLILYGIDSDGIVNQQILRSDAEAVEKLLVHSTTSLDEIEDLTGIEAFINVKRIYGSGNKITSINLSNNRQLDTLSLQGNSLQTIDLSNNTNLVKIDLNSNDLTSIVGVSTLVNLKWMSLSFNLFEEFTLDNSSVENLLMSHNDLISFNADNAPKLKTLLLRLNKITALDFSNNSLLEGLIFSGNNVESINLENNTLLEYLYCSSNLLTNLDVSNLETLNYLYTQNNPDLTCIKIKSGQNIPTLDMSSYQQINVNCN